LIKEEMAAGDVDDKEPMIADVVEVEEAEVLENAMADMELDCSVPTCNLGPVGTPWKTPPLLPAAAVQCQSNHLQYNHGAYGG
jgi:hypothetical protein